MDVQCVASTNSTAQQAARAPAQTSEAARPSATDSIDFADRALMARIVARDAEALGVLYDRYGRTVFHLILRLLGAPEAAEELTQDVFDAVWRRAATYRADRGSVRPWVFTIARNRAIDWRRTRGKPLQREAALKDAFGLSAEHHVEDSVIARLQAERVRAAVSGLPEEQRLVMSLAFWSGLSQSEIAERTGAPLGTVKSRVRLAMQRLRGSLSLERGPYA